METLEFLCTSVGIKNCITTSEKSSVVVYHYMYTIICSSPLTPRYFPKRN